MTEILMPRLSDTMESGVVLVWHKQPGDQVTPGEVLAEIETDKAVMEYEAYEAGTLGRILVGEGEEAAIGVPIALLGDGTESPTAPTRPAATAPAAAVPAVAAPDGDRPLASPLARRDARERGIDLRTLHGSGPGGRIVRADVLAAAQQTAAPPPADRTWPAGDEAAEVIPLSPLRRTIGRRLTESVHMAPHFYVTAVAEVDALVALRADLNAQLVAAGKDKVSLNDLVVRACAIALREHPEVNASLTGDGLVRHPGVHVGVAVATDDGLLVPVVRDADGKTVTAIAAATRELAERARTRRLAPDEMTGSTFTVSNLGMYGVEQFTAIINPPEAAILAVGATSRDAVVLDDGGIAARTRLRYTLSADHRILDGAIAARFLATVTRLLETPWLIVA